MTHQHELQGRTDSEILWYQRRDFLRAAAAWTALGGAATVQAQQRGNIVQLVGDATVNGARLRPEQTVQTGDELLTGPGSMLIFSIGNSAFHVRQNSRVVVERGNTLLSVSLLRLLTGAVVSVWGRGNSRSIVTPTLTAGIRGTGVYTEIMGGQDNRTYFCNCYGTVQLDAGDNRQLSRAEYHEGYFSGGAGASPSIERGPAINHTDAELEFLAGLVNQRTAWQITGRKVKPAGY
ncbi:MAG: iron dicitrate transport regulator FecR [Rubrivivax sp.]|nr:MAG: iron dicitrate transport regulator FecR [Rubrivivax sp.]